MGYYVHIDDSDWVIEENAQALATIREMPKKYHGIKRGGSSNGERWFSWMNDQDIENAESVESVFNALGFETEKVDNSFRLTGYDSKTGQEDLFLAVMAPFTKDGSYIEWCGEDNALWRYEVSDGRMYTFDSEIKWNNRKPYAYYHVDYEPETMTPRQMLVDPQDPDVDKKIALAQEWHESDQAYYAKIRADKEKEDASALS